MPLDGLGHTVGEVGLHAGNLCSLSAQGVFMGARQAWDNAQYFAGDQLSE
ncbi:hypothetical protein AZ22_1649 [Bordetella bronchiseptica 980-2]|nr:hypothetical protein AZ22_1649 [Bordetella bronchiseptica 980-2]KCV53160.1 hypothetical protein L491_1747 [Bordetella bronchiseptica 3E44]KCV59678.1 hypothetical protein AZ14_1737 [Bordetella bronchiseptica 980]KDB58459.1 hypothetical protein AZ15_1835 [Bordetella bronchiseptica A1-7]KDB74234.1 hypothetical protein AZ21_1707 [Bordetella bronchiseptica B20-10725633]KDB81103.1 hypothetical protein AZ27_1749 [Bordetella bronchiseptica D756]KDB92884.1 hypothetical protein AZ17_1734 [Bordetella